MPENHDHHEHRVENKGLKAYLPLIIIVLFCFVLAFSKDLSFSHHVFMGHFFIFFALFKFFDIHGFVEGFETYDVIAMRYRIYGYIYPFLEFALGFAYLLGGYLIIVDSFTLVLMSVSAFGVMKSVFKGEKRSCACLSTTLNVPLSTVSITENVGMALMALYGLVFAIV